MTLGVVGRCDPRFANRSTGVVPSPFFGCFYIEINYGHTLTTSFWFGTLTFAIQGPLEPPK